MKHLLLIALAAAALQATDATGTWSGTLTPSDSTEPRPAHLVLKQDGDKLTGTAGPDAGNQRPIQNGKVEEGNLSFEVPTGDTAMKFKLKQNGDEISGDITRERDGRAETARLVVKRTN